MEQLFNGTEIELEAFGTAMSVHLGTEAVAQWKKTGVSLNALFGGQITSGGHSLDSTSMTFKLSGSYTLDGKIWTLFTDVVSWPNCSLILNREFETISAGQQDVCHWTSLQGGWSDFIADAGIPDAVIDLKFTPHWAVTSATNGQVYGNSSFMVIGFTPAAELAQLALQEGVNIVPELQRLTDLVQRLAPRLHKPKAKQGGRQQLPQPALDVDEKGRPMLASPDLPRVTPKLLDFGEPKLTRYCWLWNIISVNGKAVPRIFPFRKDCPLNAALLAEYEAALVRDLREYGLWDDEFDRPSEAAILPPMYRRNSSDSDGYFAVEPPARADQRAPAAAAALRASTQPAEASRPPSRK
jgi:hypothetical protein